MKSPTNLKLLLGLVSLFVSVPNSYATVEGAIKSIEKGDYSSAIQEFNRLAKQGNSSAQNNLGYVYAKGLGVQPDPEKALYWFKQSAKKGNTEALNNIKYLLKTYPNLSDNSVKKENVQSTDLNTQQPASANYYNSSENTALKSERILTNSNVEAPKTNAVANENTTQQSKPRIEIASVANSTQEIKDLQTNRNKRIFTGELFDYTVKRHENKATLSSRFGVERRHLGKVSSGSTIQINNRHIIPHLDEIEKNEYRIVVNLPQRMLFYRTKEGAIEGRPVGVGKTTTQTPTKLVKIVQKRKDPAWYVPPSINKGPEPKVVPPGPHNPLGKFWLGLSASGYGIHGTNVPTSIYSRASHGCIRMNNEHVLALASQVNVGDQVRIIYEPILFATAPNGEIFIEVHEDGYNRRGNLFNEAQKLAKSMGISNNLDWELVKEAVKRKDGFATVVGKTSSIQSNTNDVVGTNGNRINRSGS